MEIILIILVGILLLACVGLIGYLIFFIVDESFLLYKEGKAKVISKHFEPEHDTTELRPMLSGKITILIPITVHHDDSYYITLAINGINGIKEVSKEIFEKIENNMFINTSYTKKRISNELKFKNINF